MIHADDQIVRVIICGSDLSGSLAGAVDAFAFQQPPGGRINAVAQFFCTGGGRSDLKVPCPAGKGNKIFHTEFSHGTAADVAVADKKDLDHVFTSKIAYFR
jgi:hypothetical protein